MNAAHRIKPVLFGCGFVGGWFRGTHKLGNAAPAVALIESQVQVFVVQAPPFAGGPLSLMMAALCGTYRPPRHHPAPRRSGTFAGGALELRPIAGRA